MARKKLENTWAGELVLFLVQAVGFRDAFKVGTFICQWGTVARKLGREPTWPEYCAYWGVSRATYFRELQLFRKVWPADKTPQRRWEWVEAHGPRGRQVEAFTEVLNGAR